MSRRGAVFLDRDGVINQNRSDYVKTLDEFVFLPGTIEALRRLSTVPLAIVVISNQSAIGRGLVSRQAVDTINEYMLQTIRTRGGRVDGVFVCPHTPEDNCACRKPRPGLLQQAAASLDLSLIDSYVVGDAVSDVQAALAVGCRPILVQTGRGQAQWQRLSADERAAVRVAQDLGEAVTWIMEQEEQKRRNGVSRA